jgi:hypothetical protein
VPAHGRVELARICLQQLRLTCDELTANGIDATAVIVADDENLDTARALEFATVERDNDFLSRRFNDGIQLACDPTFNPRPADYVVPCGSDDWVDYRILLTLPSPDRVLGFRQIAFVREDGSELIPHTVTYPAGCGVRVYPRALMAAVRYRPADEDRKRACDTSILMNLRDELRAAGRDLPIAYGDQHPLQLVDWKSNGQQLNAFDAVSNYRDGGPVDPFDALADVYPAESLSAMAAHYAGRMVAA